MTCTERLADRPVQPTETGPCPCGLDGHMCPGARMFSPPDGDTAAEIYEAGVAYVRAWRDEQRLFRWTREPW